MYGSRMLFPIKLLCIITAIRWRCLALNAVGMIFFRVCFCKSKTLELSYIFELKMTYSRVEHAIHTRRNKFRKKLRKNGMGWFSAALVEEFQHANHFTIKGNCLLLPRCCFIRIIERTLAKVSIIRPRRPLPCESYSKLSQDALPDSPLYWDQPSIVSASIRSVTRVTCHMSPYL